MPLRQLAESWRTLLAFPVTYHPRYEGGDHAVAYALRLGRRSAYDAAYLALAQRLGAELWTFDGPLARSAAGLGFLVHPHLPRDRPHS
ncbi:MAG: hypothetical protein EPO21_06090 [Chloroflexota bacterium]|nr:MAG: hypothetical protein EPO21_06090 [Chloroflexota bacterium]